MPRTTPKAVPCISTDFPVHTDMRSKSIVTSNGCVRGSDRNYQSLTFEGHDLVHRPYFWTQTGVCLEKLAVPYRRAFLPAIIYHKPPVSAKFFEKSHPALYKNSVLGMW